MQDLHKKTTFDAIKNINGALFEIDYELQVLTFFICPLSNLRYFFIMVDTLERHLNLLA